MPLPVVQRYLGPLADENIWLAERRKEQHALGKMIAAVSDPQAEAQAVRGAGGRKHE